VAPENPAQRNLATLSLVVNFEAPNIYRDRMPGAGRKVGAKLGITGAIADPRTGCLLHHVETVIKAHALIVRDVECSSKDGEVIPSMSLRA